MDLLSIIQEYFLFIIIGAIVLFVLLAITLANYSYDSFMFQFEKMKKTTTEYNGTALTLANFLNLQEFGGLLNVNIIEEQNSANCSYSTKNRALNLTEEVANNNSIASLAITAHEMGHALQHFKNSKQLIKNYRMSRVLKVLGILNYPLMILAISFAVFNYLTYSLIAVGLIFISFIVALILKYITIKLEKDASEFAIRLLKKYKVLPENQILLVKKFLKSARKTYVGDFFRALFAWTGLTRRTKFF